GLRDVAHRHPHQLQVEAGLGLDVVSFAEQLLGQASAHDAAAEASDSDRHEGETVASPHSDRFRVTGTMRVPSTRSRSSGDRALVSGTRCAGSSPAGSTELLWLVAFGNRW